DVSEAALEPELSASHEEGHRHGAQGEPQGETAGGQGQDGPRAPAPPAEREALDGHGGEADAEDHGVVPDGDGLSPEGDQEGGEVPEPLPLQEADPGIDGQRDS